MTFEIIPIGLLAPQGLLLPLAPALGESPNDRPRGQNGRSPRVRPRQAWRCARTAAEGSFREAGIAKGRTEKRVELGLPEFATATICTETEIIPALTSTAGPAPPRCPSKSRARPGRGSSTTKFLSPPCSPSARAPSSAWSITFTTAAPPDPKAPATCRTSSPPRTSAARASAGRTHSPPSLIYGDWGCREPRRVAQAFTAKAFGGLRQAASGSRPSHQPCRTNGPRPKPKLVRRL